MNKEILNHFTDKDNRHFIEIPIKHNGFSIDLNANRKYKLQQDPISHEKIIDDVEWKLFPENKLPTDTPIIICISNKINGFSYHICRYGYSYCVLFGKKKEIIEINRYGSYKQTYELIDVKAWKYLQECKLNISSI